MIANAQPDDANPHRTGGDKTPTHLNGYSHDAAAAKPAYRFRGDIPPALAHLRHVQRWVAWDYVWKNGRWTKPPFDPRTGRLASISNPATWTAFEVAVDGAERHGLAGIGLVLSDEDDIIGIDLDDCITDAGTFSPLAAEIIGYGESYAEVSPSGEGIRIFAFGKIDKALKDDKEGVEVYDTGRYLTITGNQIEGTPAEIRPAPRTLAKLTAIIEAAREPRCAKSNGKARASGSDFFGNVNTTALAKLDDWVPHLHPTALKQPNGAWRVTSKDLGRNLEEDLAYHPDGIRDHGEEHGLSAINAVLRFGDACDPKAAAFWLCQRMRIEPAAMGWSNNDWRRDLRPRLLALMDQGFTDDEVRAEIGREDIDGEIAHARARWKGEAQRMRAHAKTTQKTQTNAPTDGAALFNQVYNFIGRFVAYPSEHARVAHTLWIAHTHAMDAWESTPRLALLSPEPGSGKTRALEVSEPLVPRAVQAVNVSPAYLFRKVADEEGRPTVLFDEIDTVFGPKARENEEIRGLLNAGHRKGAVAGRCVLVGKKVKTEEIPAYCAVAMAGLGSLPDTILTRAVVIRMRRRDPDEQVEGWRQRIHSQEGKELGDQLAVWAESALGDVINEWPEMPDGVTDRDADVWEALLAVAKVAGGNWPERARAAAVALVAEAKQRSPSLGVRLLSDLRDVFGEAEKLPTDTILKRLHQIDEAPWGDMRGKPLTDIQLAKRLKDYSIKPKVIRHGPANDDVARGYSKADFRDAWRRYLSPLPAKAVTPVTEDPK